LCCDGKHVCGLNANASPASLGKKYVMLKAAGVEAAVSIITNYHVFTL